MTAAGAYIIDHRSDSSSSVQTVFGACFPQLLTTADTAEFQPAIDCLRGEAIPSIRAKPLVGAQLRRV